jgi:hypothetical protein
MSPKKNHLKGLFEMRCQGAMEFLLMDFIQNHNQDFELTKILKSRKLSH